MPRTVRGLPQTLEPGPSSRFQPPRPFERLSLCLFRKVEEHLAKVNSNSKEKIQLSKWREQACFWRQNSNYHRKWREQACFSMFSRWRQISNSNRMRNIRRNGARSEADLAQCGALTLPPPFLSCGCWCNFFFQRPLVEPRVHKNFLCTLGGTKGVQRLPCTFHQYALHHPCRHSFLLIRTLRTPRTFVQRCSKKMFKDGAFRFVVRAIRLRGHPSCFSPQQCPTG